jgi:hypothetical protein
MPVWKTTSPEVDFSAPKAKPYGFDCVTPAGCKGKWRLEASQSTEAAARNQGIIITSSTSVQAAKQELQEEGGRRRGEGKASDALQPPVAG